MNDAHIPIGYKIQTNGDKYRWREILEDGDTITSDNEFFTYDEAVRDAQDSIARFEAAMEQEEEWHDVSRVASNGNENN